MIRGGFDPGSRWLGLCAAPDDTAWITSDTFDLDPDRLLEADLSTDEREATLVGLLAVAVDAVVAWYAAAGVELLLIELGNWYAGKYKGPLVKACIDRWLAGLVAREKNYRLMERIVVALEARSRVATPPILTKRIPRATWCRYIDAVSGFDARGFATGVKDPQVRAALVKMLGADVVATLRTVHERDAAGVLLGAIVESKRPRLAGGGAGRRRRRGSRKGHRLSPEQRQRANEADVRYRARKRAAAIAGGWTPKVPLHTRLQLALAGGPLRQGELAAAVGYTAGVMGGALPPYLAAGGRCGVALVRIAPTPARRWALYALAEIVDDTP